jgi:hypothetical protein
MVKISFLLRTVEVKLTVLILENGKDNNIKEIHCSSSYHGVVVELE